MGQGGYISCKEKTMLRYISTVSLVITSLVVPGTALAERVRAEQYTHDLEIAKDSNTTDPFVICSGCRDGKLSPEPYTPLVIKYSAKEDDVPPPLPIESEALSVVPAKTALAHELRLVDSVFFPFDQSRLSTSEKKHLGSLTGSKVRLKGYTCSIGTNAYNLGLSKRRAESVAEYLSKNGVTVLEVSGMGKTTDHKKKRENRRVDIFKEREVEDASKK